jgi:hypothetical protein
MQRNRELVSYILTLGIILFIILTFSDENDWN